MESTGLPCAKRFERVEHLRRHEATHSGRRPFQCPIEKGRSGSEVKDCLKLFGRHDNLCDHYKTHLNPSGSARNVRMYPEELYDIIRERCSAEHCSKAIPKLEKWRLAKGLPFNRQESEGVAVGKGTRSAMRA